MIDWDKVQKYGYSELDRCKQAERDRQEQEERERLAAMVERQQDFDDWRRTALTWPEALQKQAVLYADECKQWTAELEAEFPDNFFSPGIEACNRAIEIWTEVEEEAKSEIKELEQKIQGIKDGMRLEVSSRLAAESDVMGWQAVAQAIEEIAEDNVSSWLDW